jgi:predicted nucleotidyltransferase
MKKKKAINETVIRRLKNLVPRLNKDFGVSKIGIFGSYSRGEEKINSDIDVLSLFMRSYNFYLKDKYRFPNLHGRSLIYESYLRPIG